MVIRSEEPAHVVDTHGDEEATIWGRRDVRAERSVAIVGHFILDDPLLPGLPATKALGIFVEIHLHLSHGGTAQGEKEAANQ